MHWRTLGRADMVVRNRAGSGLWLFIFRLPSTLDWTVHVLRNASARKVTSQYAILLYAHEFYGSESDAHCSHDLVILRALDCVCHSLDDSSLAAVKHESGDILSRDSEPPEFYG